MTLTAAVLPDDNNHGINQALAIGVTRRQFDYWSSQGFVYDPDPDEDSADRPGSGNPRRLLNEDELARLATMRRLVYAGVTPRVAHQLARDLVATGTAEFAGLTLVDETQSRMVGESAA